MTLPWKTAMACKIPRLQWTDGIIRFHCYWQKLRTAIVLPICSKSVSDGHWRPLTAIYASNPGRFRIVDTCIIAPKVVLWPRDFFRIVTSRGSLCVLLLYPPDVQGNLSDLINQAQTRTSWVSVTNNYLIKHTCFILNVGNRWLDHLYVFYIVANPSIRHVGIGSVLELKVRIWYGLRLLVWL